MTVIFQPEYFNRFVQLVFLPAHHRALNDYAKYLGAPRHSA